jgi:hypothetical protein
VPLSAMGFAGAALGLLPQETPNTATEIIAITSDNRGLRKGVIKPPFWKFGLFWSPVTPNN